ncbi:MAG: CPBP family intramembrane glutamic endopeptidase [Phycisphaerales bacterium]
MKIPESGRDPAPLVGAPDVGAVASKPTELPAGARLRRWCEMVVMFVVAPLVLAVFMRGWLVFRAIWALGAVCLVALLRDPTFDRRQMGNRRGFRAGWRFSAVSFLMLAPMLTAALWILDPGRVLSLPLQRPGLWAVIMVGYPVLSVYPQEVAFRAFFVHRYEMLMSRNELVWMCAVAFGFAHIIMHNWFAVAACTVGGVLFTLNYLRTRSVLSVSLEHAAYGCFMFTVGWGSYFYGGSMGR